MRDEVGTTAFFVIEIDEGTYGVFSTFADQESLDKHAAGGTGRDVVAAMVGSVFAAPPTITIGRVLQHHHAGGTGQRVLQHVFDTAEMSEGRMDLPIHDRDGPESGPPERQTVLSADDEALWRSLGRVVQQLPRVVDAAMMRGTGLTMTAFSVLDAVRSSADHVLRMTDFAVGTGLSASRVSRVVDSMVPRGWCRRESDSTDGRAALVRLTDDGLAVAHGASEQQVRIARDLILDHLPRALRPEFIAALTSIAERAAKL